MLLKPLMGSGTLFSPRSLSLCLPHVDQERRLQLPLLPGRSRGVGPTRSSSRSLPPFGSPSSPVCRGGGAFFIGFLTGCLEFDRQATHFSLKYPSPLSGSPPPPCRSPRLPPSRSPEQVLRGLSGLLGSPEAPPAIPGSPARDPRVPLPSRQDPASPPLHQGPPNLPAA